MTHIIKTQDELPEICKKGNGCKYCTVAARFDPEKYKPAYKCSYERYRWPPMKGNCQFYVEKRRIYKRD